jgi:GT2 family glycosyltransferase
MTEAYHKLVVSLVIYNGEKYLPGCLNSLINQSFKDFSLLIINNGSSDNGLAYLKEFYPQLKLVNYKNNIGFARAHNQAISWTKSDYICLLNQDVILEPDYFLNAIEFMDSHPEAAALSGKILAWDFPNQQKTDQIDSLGLKILKSHRVVDIGQGETDQGQYQQIEEVFGVSGALPIYRRMALEKIRIQLKNSHPEYFDELFFSYKEDVDLSYRLRLANFQSFYLPMAVAYHDRTIKGNSNSSGGKMIKNRKERNKLIKVYSYKNHLLVIMKNEFCLNLFKYFFPIFLYELKKFLYILFFEQNSLGSIPLLMKQRKEILQKRRFIVKNIRTVKPEDLSKWYY